MQNKPNFSEVKMSVNSVLAKDYEEISDTTLGQNKPNSNPIQSQTKPICQKPKMSVNKVLTKDYEKNRALRLPKNKPNQTQCQNRQNEPERLCAKGVMEMMPKTAKFADVAYARCPGAFALLSDLPAT